MASNGLVSVRITSPVLAALRLIATEHATTVRHVVRTLVSWIAVLSDADLLSLPEVPEPGAKSQRMTFYLAEQQLDDLEAACDTTSLTQT